MTIFTDKPQPSLDLISDLVMANHILAHLGIVDAFGHVSVRSDQTPDRFLLSRNLAPERVSCDDIVQYRLDGSAVDSQAPKGYLERYIHSAIYSARPDVNAIVHSHSPSVIPFSVSAKTTFKPICHMSGFLSRGVSKFEIRDTAGNASDLLIKDENLGRALAKSLGLSDFVLMRGHGSTTVASSLKLAVYRAYYAENNARLQLQALQLGDPQYLSPQEANTAMESVESQVDRPWNLWCAAVTDCVDRKP